MRRTEIERLVQTQLVSALVNTLSFLYLGLLFVVSWKFHVQLGAAVWGAGAGFCVLSVSYWLCHRRRQGRWTLWRRLRTLHDIVSLMVICVEGEGYSPTQNQFDVWRKIRLLLDGRSSTISREVVLDTIRDAIRLFART